MKKSDSTIISGMMITRNFITRHMGLDCEIPCTMAGIVILGDKVEHINSKFKSKKMIFKL